MTTADPAVPGAATRPGIPADVLRAKADRPRREIFLVIGHCSAPLAAVGRYRAEHLGYLHDLAAAGSLLLAGPTLAAPDDVYAGDGCFLLHTANAAAAQAIAARDPYHRHGVRRNAVTPWLASEGLLFAALPT
jgi:uncharacterized protein YciI